MAPADELDTIAGVLRDELVARAGRDDAQDVEAQIRALVDERAGILDAPSREELARRVAQRSLITPTMRAASLPTPWIIVDDMAY